MAAYKQKLNAAKFFLTLINETTGEAKIKVITKCLDEGANVNEQFKDDSNNTPLHISVIHGDVDMVNLLLERGAKINYKNIAQKTAVDIARELDFDVGGGILKLLEEYEATTQIKDDVTVEIEVKTDILSLLKHEENEPKLCYRKRASATGIKGQLYESKLLTLILIRASLNDEIEEFYLGTSLEGIGALDDICVRYKTNNVDGVVFLQAKHRSDVKKSKVTVEDLWKAEGDLSLKKYYQSYLTIRQKFKDANQNDLFFNGKYENLKFTFAIYTTAECDFKNEVFDHLDSIHTTPRDLINTSDSKNICKYKYNDSDVDLLTNVLVIDHMKYIGKILAYFILKGKYDMLMNDSHIKKYHVILARYVINVSDVTAAGYRVGTFRKDFFDSQDSKLLTLKFILYKEFVKAQKPNEKEMKEIIVAVRNNPSEETICKLMQNAVTNFDENKTLVVQDDRFRDITIQRFRLSGKFMLCSNAFASAVHKILGTISFKLPSLFGNMDIAVANGNKGEKRLQHLAVKIDQLFDSTRTEPAVLDPGFLSLNGGLGSAVGNLLILDEQGTYLVLNTNENTLGKNAKYLLSKLKSRIKNIDVVKFSPGALDFPYVTLDASEREKHVARAFFNDLWFYTCQSTEDVIEKHAKEAMQDYCIAKRQEPCDILSEARYDAVYFIIHDAVQKWWMTDEQSQYLTNKRNYLERLLIEFSGKSLVNVMSCMFVNRMSKYGITFNNEAIHCLSSLVGPEAIILITEVTVLTGIKLAQYFNDLNDYAFIDLNDITGISKNDYNIIIQELKSFKLKALIILYEDLTAVKTIIFLRLIKNAVTKKYLLVTNEKSAPKLQSQIKHNTFVILHDVRNDLNALDLLSQTKILDSTFKFQGVVTNFSKIITNETKHLITPKVLQKITCNDIINIGKSLSNPYYEDIKHYYVQRRLHENSSSTNSAKPFTVPELADNRGLIEITTLEALKDTVVIVGAPGMGKSTFLTYLSIQTKQQNPNVWIERINLLDQTKELHRLQENKVKINKTDALKFVCKSALSTNLIRFSITPKPIPKFDLDVNNGIVVLTNCDALDALVLFELKMFLQCYNHGNTILLFDGFDEICPHYRIEMTDILKCLITNRLSDNGSNVNQRLWITGRSYNNIGKMLETEFSASYNLDILTNEEQQDLLNKYFQINMSLTEMNLEQIQKIDGFFEFMKRFIERNSIIINNNSLKRINSTTCFLFSLYKSAMKYFCGEINKPQTTDKQAFRAKWSAIFDCKFSYDISVTNPHNGVIDKNEPQSKEAISEINTPLHVHIVLDYLQNQIKTVDATNVKDIPIKWDLGINTSSFYDYYIMTKLKKIRFEEKNQMDIYNPDIIMTYEKELNEVSDMHKKLAFYASFTNDLTNILTDGEIEEIRDILESIESGRENTGVIDCILNDGVPKFVHLSIQEFLAVEYISDLLKTGHIKHVKLWTFISSRISDGVLEFFDRKLQLDDELMNIIKDRDFKQFIFDEITYDRTKNDNGINLNNDTVFNRALNLTLSRIIKMFLIGVADIVCSKNLDKFIAFLNNSKLVYCGMKLGWDDILTVILNCITRVDPSKLFKCDLELLHTLFNAHLNPKDILGEIKWYLLQNNNIRKGTEKDSIKRRRSV